MLKKEKYTPNVFWVYLILFWEKNLGTDQKYNLLI